MSSPHLGAPLPVMVRGGTPRGARAADAVGDTAEVVFLGELTGATGFKDTTRGSVLCKYVVVHGEHWHLDKGSVSGATQAAATSGFGGELAPWGHPFQLAFNTTSVQGWPKLLFAVYERDALAGVDSFVGYGVQSLPLKPGMHDLKSSIFVANDRNARQTQRIREFFNNTRPELEGWRGLLLHREEMHAAPVVTVGMGEIHLKVGVLQKGMDISGLHVKRVVQTGGKVGAKYGGGHSPRGNRSPRGDRSPRPQSPSPMKEDGNPIETVGDRAQRSGLASVRRRFTDAAADAVEAAYAPGDGDSNSNSGSSAFASTARRARRSAGVAGAANAFSAAANLGRSGEAPAGRRARHARASAGDATAALVSERRADRAVPSGGEVALGGSAPDDGTVPSTYGHQREAIEDAPLASGRDARRAAREARVSDPEPTGRRARGL